MKRLAFTALSVAFLLISGSALAQDQLKPRVRSRDFSSPQNFALEFRFSPYTPLVDDEPGLNGTPYKDTYGTMPRLLFGFEFDWQVLRIPHVGTLGPGFGVAFTDMSTKAKLAGSTRDSGQDTDLQIVPFTLAAVFRVDVLANELNIPIVPYVKAGLGMGLWRAYGPNGTTEAKSATPGGYDTRGKGFSIGSHLALGGMLRLDFFEPSVAREADQSLGMNHSYLFFEYYSANYNGLFQSNALNVGSRTWAAGLAFEF